MPTEMLTKNGHRASSALPSAVVPAEKDELRTAARRQVKRVHRLKIHAGAWALGTIVLTALWVLNEWQANGGFEHFGTGATRATGTRRSGPSLSGSGG